MPTPIGQNIPFALAGMTFRGGSRGGERALFGDSFASSSLPSSLLGSSHGGGVRSTGSYLCVFPTGRKSVQESPQTRIFEVAEQHALDM
jgi:hypothetical protein